jgi:hypothetical protein
MLNLLTDSVYCLLPGGAQVPHFIKAIGHAGNTVPANWISNPEWQDRLRSVVFPKNPRSVVQGSRLIYYAAGTRRFCAVLEVTSDGPEPTTEGDSDRWPYQLAVRPLVAIPADHNAPTLEEVGFDPLRVRRQSHVRLTDAEYARISTAIVRAAKANVR